MSEKETHTLFNLTYEGKQYVSTISPSRLPTDNYSFVEIVYDDKMVIHVRGTYVFEGKKEEIILSDLDFFSYLKKLKSLKEDTEDTKNQEDNEIEFMGVEQPENKEELIFILSVCSYLVYFHFLNLPYDLSLDLLDNNAIKLFISNLDSKNSLNIVSEAWNTQVITFGKRYFYLFHSKYLSSSSMSSMNLKTTKPLPEPPVESEKEKDIGEGNIKEKDIQEVKALIHEEVSSSEIKEATNKKEIERYIKKTVKKYIEKETKAAIQKIEKEAQEIAKEIKEYKKRFLLDISKQSGIISKK